DGAPDVAYSSCQIICRSGDKPRPPYCRGQEIPDQPPSYRRLIQAVANRRASGPPGGQRVSGMLLFSHARAAWRKASSSSVNFRWSAAEQAFRARIIDFLRTELPDDWDQVSRHGPGSREQTEFSLKFCPRLGDAELLVPHWPKEYGGQSGSVWEHQIQGEEMW